MNQFEKIIQQGLIPCDICGHVMLPIRGGGWDNDRIICANRECGAEIEYPTSTEPPPKMGAMDSFNTQNLTTVENEDSTGEEERSYPLVYSSLIKEWQNEYHAEFRRADKLRMEGLNDQAEKCETKGRTLRRCVHGLLVAVRFSS